MYECAGTVGVGSWSGECGGGREVSRRVFVVAALCDWEAEDLIQQCYREIIIATVRAVALAIEL